jgi:hypothetical protein
MSGSAEVPQLLTMDQRAVTSAAWWPKGECPSWVSGGLFVSTRPKSPRG